MPDRRENDSPESQEATIGALCRHYAAALLSGDEVAAEVAIREAEPMVTSLYLEPDIYRPDYTPAPRPERPAPAGH